MEFFLACFGIISDMKGLQPTGIAYSCSTHNNKGSRKTFGRLYMIFGNLYMPEPTKKYNSDMNDIQPSGIVGL